VTQDTAITIKCEWCGEIVCGERVLGRPIVIQGNRAHRFRERGVVERFERREELEMVA
jgi:hypothetical protein